MINAAYTLLMNVDGSLPPDVTTPGIEFIDPTFRALNLPTYLDTVRAVIFGSTPDRVMLAYRCRELLAIVHATVLESHIVALDPRLTYRFAENVFCGASLFRPVITELTPGLVPELAVIGIPEAPDVTGVARSMYLLEILTTTTVKISRQTPPMQNTVFEFAPGDLLPLRGSGYSARLKSAAADNKWLVEVINRPQRTPSEILDMLGKIGEAVIHALFGVTEVEPYATLRHLWNNSLDSLLRLSAAVVAIAYRAEAVRLHA